MLVHSCLPALPNQTRDPAAAVLASRAAGLKPWEVEREREEFEKSAGLLPIIVKSIFFLLSFSSSSSSFSSSTQPPLFIFLVISCMCFFCDTPSDCNSALAMFARPAYGDDKKEGAGDKQAPSSALASRFAGQRTAEDGDSAFSAARAGMYGRLTRTRVEWRPDKVALLSLSRVFLSSLLPPPLSLDFPPVPSQMVCRRFNVPDPFFGRPQPLGGAKESTSRSSSCCSYRALACFLLDLLPARSG